MRISVHYLLRLIVCLVPSLFFAQVAFAADYYWTQNQNPSSGHTSYSNPDNACSTLYDSYSVHQTNYKDGYLVTMLSPTTAKCDVYAVVRSTGNRSVFISYSLFRHGTSCPNPTDTFNPTTGNCDQPDQCLATENMGAVHMFLGGTRASPTDPWPSGEVSSPYAICRAGCRFTAAAGEGTMTCGTLIDGDPLQQHCIRMYTGIGGECQGGEEPLFAGPGIGNGGGGPDGEPPSDDPLDFPPLIGGDDPTDPANNCGPGYVWTGTTCAKVFVDENPGDGGNDGGGDSGGGGNNGGGDSGGGDTGGGDSGGGDTGGGDTGGGNPGTGGGGGGCGAGSCPGEGDEYDGSAEWSDGEATALGDSTGTTIGDSLTEAVDGALEGREQEIEDALGEIPGQVEDWFGDLPSLSFLDNLFVPAAGCSELVIPVDLGQYSFSMPIDFCVLSRFKTLLEWVIWCLTAIAVWNVYYSGLRLQNATASRGGF